MGKFLCLRYFHNLDPLASGRLDDALYFHIALKSLFRSTSLREARHKRMQTSVYDLKI